MIAWNRKHLLGLEDLSKDEIVAILDTADSFASRSPSGAARRSPRSRARSSSTSSSRIRPGPGPASASHAKRLSADVQDFSASVSSLAKGETFIDTARNLEAMGADVLVVRHPTPGAPHLLAKHVKASIINAGDGAHEHPTQGLLDLMTIRQRKGPDRGADRRPDRRHRSFPGRPVEHLGPAQARGEGDPLRTRRPWSPAGSRSSAARSPTTSTTILPRCDVVNALRIQKERQERGLFPSLGEYFHFYGLTAERLARRPKPTCSVLANPGPINRGVELTPEVADGPQSAILAQVDQRPGRPDGGALPPVSGKGDGLPPSPFELPVAMPGPANMNGEGVEPAHPEGDRLGMKEARRVGPGPDPACLNAACGSILIQGGRLIDPSQGIDRVTDVSSTGGRVMAIGEGQTRRRHRHRRPGDDRLPRADRRPRSPPRAGQRGRRDDRHRRQGRVGRRPDVGGLHAEHPAGDRQPGGGRVRRHSRPSGPGRPTSIPSGP